MNTRRVRDTILTLGVVLGCATAQAHHSFAMFDRKQDVALTGTVAQFQWQNPHGYIQLIADQDKQNWSIETAGVNSLMRNGWRPSSLSVGDKVTIHIHPLRNGAAGGALMWLKKSDGTVLRGSPESEEPSKDKGSN